MEEYNKLIDDTTIEKPSVTVDIVVFTIKNDDLQVLLIKRKSNPYIDKWAIPGGFIQKRETLDQAALRELKQKTGVENLYLEQLYTFGDPDRDPRTRVITVSYYSLVCSDKLLEDNPQRENDIKWFSVKHLPSLAFDHRSIINAALERLQAKIAYSNVCFQLLPNEFTLSELQMVHEVILSKKLDKRNFRKRIMSLNILTETNKTKMEGYHRPAKVYSFRQDNFSHLI